MATSGKHFKPAPVPAPVFATQIIGATMPEYRDVIVQLKRDMAEA